MRDAGLVELGSQHPDVIRQGVRDLDADIEPLGVDAIVVGNQDAHALGRGAAHSSGFAVHRPLVRPPLLGHPCLLAHCCRSMTFRPPMYGCSTSGTVIEPPCC